ncbi:ABC transporter ATP-binding protein/permease [Nocardioides sp. TRM66260-LWL]|uniref:ATP-binding cassette domain-containing protein n=1 Tax=Nocardioides sp. TRM66260-LWL TaxID=2874478 RepID=UPI001CC651B5|nr:ABC transporter ATP-binding protein [Nocardioides sp. TRM66260-LWL]MBZ5733645.1 ABC transporter ATP-binding protein/permease [Nocardioides sp. TRM66260-LWL]
MTTDARADVTGGTAHAPDRRPVDWRRLARPATALCLLGCVIGALGAALASVVAGRIADGPGAGLIGLLAICALGGALVETAARTGWSAVVTRAEGELRADLLDAALAQPLAALGETAVGEILDRVDDDTWEVGRFLRQIGWMTLRAVLGAGPLWIIAGLTWWPAFLLFPIVAAAALLWVRPLLRAVTDRKVAEEIAWTDHAAITEEGIAARDDLRTSLGQAHVLRRSSELAAVVHERFWRVSLLQRSISLRTGVVLHSLLVVVAVVGVALAGSDRLSTASLVTLFLVAGNFVGQVDMVARHLPEIQAGFGAVLRLRSLLEVEPEPVGGRPLPDGLLDVEFRDLRFSYGTGRFALAGVDLHVPAGQTCALVGRTGSGKSTLASLVSRAVEPPRGSVLIGGVDVRDLDLQQLRSGIGVVTQRTEILAGTVAENITLFADLPRERVEAAVAELGLEAWVAGLPQGLDTPLGAGGTTLSAGEEQLVAFARLLVRDVRIVVLDEATARMDPVTEAQVVRAADRLLRGRTGLLVAHRLSTTARAERLAVLDDGRVVQSGARAELALVPGPFRDLLTASDERGGAPVSTLPDAVPAAGADRSPGSTAPAGEPARTAVGGVRRTSAAPEPPATEEVPSLTRSTTAALLSMPRWSLTGLLLFLLSAVLGAFGALTGWVWGHVVTDLQAGTTPWALTAVVVVFLLAGPVLLSQALVVYVRWWVDVKLRVRAAVLAGQVTPRRLLRTPPGEVVSRAMDADRLAQYSDRWVDLLNGAGIVVITMVVAGTPLAGLVLVAVMVASAGSSALGRRVAGRSAAASATARAGFGRALVSAMECVRTVKLAGATDHVHRHLGEVDGGRVEATVMEYRVKALLEGVPIVMVQAGIVAAWAAFDLGVWGLATTLLVANAVAGFDWFGRVAGSAITEAPGTRAWLAATSPLAGGGLLTELPDGVDLISGVAPAPTAAAHEPLRSLSLRGLTAVHDDGTIGVADVDLDLAPGELVLLLGPIGSGKSSLLGALAGLISTRGELRWNDRVVDDPETWLRPPHVAHVAQVPRVLSGSFIDNIRLDHPDRRIEPALAAARLGRDLAAAGGPEALVGHRGVRLSGGQVQRLALARALACDADLLLADDVSSALDAATELELWAALRERGGAVLGATSKAAALARADRVVVLQAGRVAAVGPWPSLASRWSHLAG